MDRGGERMIFRQIDYAKQCIEDKRYDMLLDALGDIEWQANRMVSKQLHEEQIMAKNIELKMMEYNLNDSIHERVTLISQLKRAEETIKELNPSFRDRYYSKMWERYE